MAEFLEPEDFQVWLKRQSDSVAIAFTARAALRAVPTLAAILGVRQRKTMRDVVLPLFRVAATLSTAARYPVHMPAIGSALNGAGPPARAAIHAAAARATHIDSRAGHRAAHAIATAAETIVVTSAATSSQLTFRRNFGNTDAIEAVAQALAVHSGQVRSSAQTRKAARTSIYAVVAADANAIENGMDPSVLAKSPLWMDQELEWSRAEWARLRRAMLALQDGWEVWTNWYEAQRDGLISDEALEVARVLIANEIWTQSPRLVNAEIARLIKAHGPAVDETPEAPAHWDFYLSYSNENEDFARWITSLIRATDRTVFAQFSDIPPGSNFVREMQRGLAQSSRIIALQSPAYLKSDHCQAEWSEAYGRDPGGTGRALVPFLLIPTDLPPLARQIVFTSLVGLSPADAASAVLKSIGYEGPIPEVPPGWPGSAAIETIQAATGGIYNVAPSESGLLERQPTAISSEGEGGFTPEQLFVDLAREIADLSKHIEKNKGNFTYSDRLKARALALFRTTSIGFSDCDALTLNKQLVWVLRTIALDLKDGLIPANDEVEMYAADLFGYYNRLEHIFPQLKVYRKMDARQRFTSPTPEVGQAIEIIYGSFGDPRIASGALSANLSEELKEAGKDIAKAKQLDESRPFEDTRDVTVESHTNAATRSLAVWNWLANASDKFAKSGKKVDDLQKTIESYEKLYGTLSPQMQTYLGYLLKWFF